MKRLFSITLIALLLSSAMALIPDETVSGSVSSGSSDAMAVLFDGGYLGSYQAGSDVQVVSNIKLNLGSRAINDLRIAYEIYGPCLRTDGLCVDENNKSYNYPLFSSGVLDSNDLNEFSRTNEYGEFKFKLTGHTAGKLLPGSQAVATLTITGPTSSQWKDGHYHVLVYVYDGANPLPLRKTAFDQSCNKDGQTGCAWAFGILTAGELNLTIVAIGVLATASVLGIAWPKISPKIKSVFKK